MLDRVRETILRYSMLPLGSRVGVAVSGGADSTCLLHILARLDVELVVLHLNHKLRGGESDADEQFVRTLAMTLGLPFISESIDLAA
ncbi:MAG: ATP-binding protein [Bryobacteraceae bacterium]